VKCRQCGRTAVMHMRPYRLSLCEKHYDGWFVDQTKRTIRTYDMFGHSDRILVAVSGGKDSLSLWDVLLRLGYQVDGLYIDLGIDRGERYSARSREFVERFAASRPGTTLRIADLNADYGETLQEVARHTRRARGKPCALCGLIKRHAMNRVALDEAYTVLATGHNLDDEATALFGNVLHWQTGYLARQAPVLPADSAGLARKVKPLCRRYERETAAYAILAGIEYIIDECPFAAHASSLRYKDLLNRLETDSPGALLQFYGKFLKQREDGLFEAQAVELHKCSHCGQPTSAPDLCAFCRLWPDNE